MSGPTSRRTFLHRVAAVPAALAAGSALTEALPAPVTPDDEAYWEVVRRQFAFGEDKVPMNAANLCPSPRVVAEAVSRMTHDIDVDCSSQNRLKFAELREASRAALAGQIGASPDEIALVRNTSEANNTINNGFPLKAGDEVVLWDQNHPTNNVAWDVRAARYDATIKRVTTPLRPSGTDELVDAFRRALTPKTRVLTITHVSNVSGLRLPVREICEIAHQRDIYVHVDGAQCWGVLQLDLGALGCDSYSASAHKWFVGPKEAGLLYIKAEQIDRIWPSGVAPGWGDDVESDLKGARKFESLGQRDDACLAAVGVTVDFHAALGPARVEARVLALAERLKAGLRELGATLITPMEPELSAGVCIADADDERCRELFQRLYTEHGIAGATTGGLRLCPHLYNTVEHVDRALEGVKALQSLIA
jgi:selenocysteine lyase/cysteine desulfurase